MVEWRERALAPFVAGAARLWLAADPDRVLLEAGVIEELQQRGFELLTFDDPVTFRFAYESGYRARWDRGENLEQALVVRSDRDNLRTLPYDLLQGGRKVQLGLAELFPGLAYGVVAALDSGDLDALDRAWALSPGEVLGDNATKDFVLRQVFHLDADQVSQGIDLLRTLLMLHTSGRAVPSMLADRLAQRLRQQGRFEEWPLEQLVGERELFLRFVQERWPRFVARWVAKTTAEPGRAAELSRFAEGLTAYDVPGPVDLQLGEEEIRRYVDTLFLEGLLSPVESPGGDLVRREDLAGSWIAVGIRSDPGAERTARLRALVERLSERVPSTDARHQEWLGFARSWAELGALQHDPRLARDDALAVRISDLVTRIDVTFGEWMQRRYAALYSLAGGEPVMVHHVPRAMARGLEEGRYERVALLLVDGLALDQWVVLREALRAQRPSLGLHEAAVFAWVPTITSVSRQAAFAGRVPLNFASSIKTTSKEPTLWRQYWADQGLGVSEAGYARETAPSGVSATLTEMLAQPRLRALGLVVDAVDSIMHGMQLGTAGMHNQVRQWADQGVLAELLDRLLDRGCTVFLTADHGNVQASGIGNPGEAALALSRGERVRIYADPLLRTRVKERFPDAIEWPSIGLPPGYLPLLAPGRSAFIPFGQQRVTHGGITLEEVIVPFVRIEAKT